MKKLIFKYNDLKKFIKAWIKLVKSQDEGQTFQPNEVFIDFEGEKCIDNYGGQYPYPTTWVKTPVWQNPKTGKWQLFPKK